MKSSINALIKKALFFLLLLVFLDQLTGRLLNYLYFKYEQQNQTTTTYVADCCKEDMIILGSSRAVFHYIPNIITDSTKLSCFNAGLQGQFVFYSYAMLKCVLTRYTPKVIVFDIMPNEFKYAQENYDRLSVLLPYYQQHPEIRDLINQKSAFEPVKLLSRTYPFNSLILGIVSSSVRGDKSNTNTDTQNGFVGLTDSIKVKGTVFMDNKYDNYKTDPNLIKTYRLLIKQCVDHHIKLYIMVSPVLYKSYYETKSIQIEAKIAAENHVSFVDYTKVDGLKKKQYFSDFGHLNINGARIFSKMVGAYIKQNP